MNKLNKTLWYAIPFAMFIDSLMHCYLSGYFDGFGFESTIIGHAKMITMGFILSIIWDYPTYLAYVVVLYLAHNEISKLKGNVGFYWCPIFYGFLLFFISCLMAYVFGTKTHILREFFFLGRFLAGFFQGLLVWRLLSRS
ncbi:hypothetical protein [Arcticibacterium luteifluviistationis]|uniref:Uncharacterized protein n=1 Tax=Arcticibacterium luteifluviistationis TaxID=1784714 RepID=A0A2Z4G8I5_9BACT|nr:hypothetical protein [Arcticibacterium luteifluviistationis]AWV97522.1 hypothetical protein DJ013_04820 [Arcticibacterium luteifluviistationis]